MLGLGLAFRVRVRVRNRVRVSEKLTMTKAKHTRRGNGSGVGRVAYGAIGRQLATLLKTQKGGYGKRGAPRIARAVAAKSSKARTMTKVKEECERESLDTTQHNDLSHKFFKVVLRKPQKLYKPLGDFQYLDNFQKCLTNGEGYQGITTMKALFASTSFVNANGNRAEELLLAQTPFDLNPFETTTGGGVIGSVVKPAPDYIHCKSVHGMFMVKNGSNIAMSIQLVWYQCKKNTNLSPYDMWVYAVQQKQLGQSAAGAVTQTSGATNTAGYTGVTQYGQSPHAEKTFNLYWKRLKHFDFDLQGGGTRKFNYSLFVNKTFSKAQQQQHVNVGNTYVQGQTIVPMIIMRPTPVTISDTAGPKEATIAATEIIMVESHQYRWTAMASGRLEYDRIFPGIIQGGVHNVGERTVNDVDVSDGVVII